MDRTNLLRIAAIATLLGGCTLKEPTPTGIPFVSEQIIGHWLGKWSAPLPGQVGTAEVSVVRDVGDVVDWQMWLDGGALSGPDDPPLYYHLRGADDIDTVNLIGDGPLLGHIDLTIDKRGIAKGTSYPETMGPVDIVGIVGEDYIRLDFLLLEVLHGKAFVTFEGKDVVDADTDGDPFADPPADAPAGDTDTDAPTP